MVLCILAYPHPFPAGNSALKVDAQLQAKAALPEDFTVTPPELHDTHPKAL